MMRDVLPRLRVGLAGYGYWGPNLLRALRRSSRGQLVAVCDCDPARLQQLGRDCPDLARFEAYGEMIAAVDAVVLATPMATHAPLALEALRRGRHVLVEKPLCCNVSEARALLDCAQRCRRVLAVGHTYLYSPAVQFIGQELRSGRMGRLCYIRSGRLNPAGYRSDANVLWDLAVHDVAILHFWLRAAPVEMQVMARGRTALDAPEVALIHLCFPDNILVQLEVSRLAPCKQRSMELVGSRKRLLFDDLRQFDKLRLFPADPPPCPDLDANALHRGALPGEIVIPHLAGVEPLQAEVDDFLGAIQSGTTPLSDGALGLEVIRTLERLQRACNGALGRTARRHVQSVCPTGWLQRGITIPINSSPCFSAAFSISEGFVAPPVPVPLSPGGESE